MRRTASALLVAAVLAACSERPAFLERQTAHEAYGESLRKAELHETALGRDWLTAADAALRDPKPAKLPLESALTFTAAEVRAFGFRFELKRGRVLRVEVGPPESAADTLVFLDLYRASEQPGDPPRPVASAPKGGRTIDHEVERDGTYLLRIQPELLRGGTLTITQRTTASLGFPVAARGASVQSFFRDPRDGGRREHHGVDIFAPRDTPVVAAATGVVSSVATTRLGGHVVWIWDGARRQSHYYAHLSRQSVRTGERVRAGDVIGYVGNTGNARGTPPHLHFGIYAVGDGPIDPLPFVQGAPRTTSAATD
jgi:murein DD-endopeptidase MepM/ murein hydrolase activator NlpD